MLTGPRSTVITLGKGVAITLHTFAFFNSSLEFIADVQVISKALYIIIFF